MTRRRELVVAACGRRVMVKRIEEPIVIKIIADHVEADQEMSDLVDRLEAEADRDIADAMVTLRWGKEQIDVVKRAAALLGIPYQTYMKHVVFKQALADIEHTSELQSRQYLVSRL